MLYRAVTEMFASPAKNSAQCTDVENKLHSIWEESDFKTNLLQLSSFTNLFNLMIDRFVKLESCNKFVLKSFCSPMLYRAVILDIME